MGIKETQGIIRVCVNFKVILESLRPPGGTPGMLFALESGTRIKWIILYYFIRNVFFVRKKERCSYKKTNRGWSRDCCARGLRGAACGACCAEAGAEAAEAGEDRLLHNEGAAAAAAQPGCQPRNAILSDILGTDLIELITIGRCRTFFLYVQRKRVRTKKQTATATSEKASQGVFRINLWAKTIEIQIKEVLDFVFCTYKRNVLHI